MFQLINKSNIFYSSSPYAKCQWLIMMFLNNQKVIFAYFLVNLLMFHLILILKYPAFILTNMANIYLLFFNFFSGNCDFNAVSELRGLKSRLEELESDLKDRDEEIKSLKDTSSQLKAVNGEDSDIVKVIIVKNRQKVP